MEMEDDKKREHNHWISDIVKKNPVELFPALTGFIFLGLHYADLAAHNVFHIENSPTAYEGLGLYLLAALATRGVFVQANRHLHTSHVNTEGIAPGHTHPVNNLLTGAVSAIRRVFRGKPPADKQLIPK